MPDHDENTARATRLPLTDEEREILARSREGFPEQVRMEARQIDDVEVHGVLWEGKPWRAARVERSHFIECKFFNVDFTESELADVRFEHCEFVACRFADSRLERCHFVQCQLQSGLFRRGQWAECLFDASVVIDLMFEELSLHACHFREGRMADVRFSECKLGALQCTELEISAVRLTLCQGGPVVLEACNVDDLLVLGGAYAAWTMRGGTANNVRFRALEGGVVHLENLSSAQWIHVKESNLQEFSITHCPSVSDLYVWQSRIQLLSLGLGTFEGWVTECELGAGSAVTEATLLGFFWDATKSVGLTFDRVTFTEAICARGANFVGMRLLNPTYGANLEFILDGATFEDSNRFLEGAK